MSSLALITSGVEPPRPISVTFIPATVFDNSALLQVNPEYLGSLLSLPTLERERLLGGNWKIRPAAGLYFKREWCAVVDAVPADLDVVGYWGLAATEKTEFNDPGLLAEEYDPRARRQVGNFPQAFSHVALRATADARGAGRANITAR
jgi:hypothetical protein